MIDPRLPLQIEICDERVSIDGIVVRSGDQCSLVDRRNTTENPHPRQSKGRSVTPSLNAATNSVIIRDPIDRTSPQLYRAVTVGYGSGMDHHPVDAGTAIATLPPKRKSRTPGTRTPGPITQSLNFPFGDHSLVQTTPLVIAKFHPWHSTTRRNLRRLPHPNISTCQDG